MTHKRQSEVDIVARAMEVYYHGDCGICSPEDGFPETCWHSMRGFASAAIRALDRYRKARKKREKRR